MSMVSDFIDRHVNGVRQVTQPIGKSVEQKVSENIPQTVKDTAVRAGQDVKQYAETTKRGAMEVHEQLRQEHYRQATSAPVFGRPRPTRATIYRYGGVGNGGGGPGGAPDFSIGNNHINFSTGGSVVNTAHLHGFGAMQPGGMFGSLSGLSGKSFGMNDGRLNFTRATFEKNRKKKKED